MIKKWEYHNIDKKVSEEISKKFNINMLTAEIICNRKVGNDEEIRKFLNPTRKDFYDPFLFKDMDKAVERIIKAINNNEKTTIYGDYDVDGITSTTVLKKFLYERGLDTDTYIPNRLDEGYGLNKDAIKKIANENNTLIITVDCGISAIEEVEYANSLGIETVITDHHEVAEVMPNAVCIIDAKRTDNTYPFKGLAGVGVVFKLIQAISIKLKLEEKEYLKYLDLVCIGTISDIVPLIDENRVIAKLGLKLIEQTKNIGLKELINSSSYKSIDSNTVSFGIAPRINACGRMGEHEEALKLFLINDEKEAKKITNKLNKYNKIRQQTEKRIFEEVVNKINSENLTEKSAIVVGSNNWHHGVIGIVSSKITDMYFKPSVLICFEGNEGKGSGRSIQGFDLHDTLSKCKTLLKKYGGHEMAVGLSLDKENFQEFRDIFEKNVKEAKIDEIIPIIYVDKEINLKDLKKEEIIELNLLEPFGEKNKNPIFMMKNLKINSIRALSEGKHMKLTLKDNNNNILVDAIGFNQGNLVNEFLIGDKVDVVGTIELNEFNGSQNLQINIKDIRKTSY